MSYVSACGSVMTKRISPLPSDNILKYLLAVFEFKISVQNSMFSQSQDIKVHGRLTWDANRDVNPCQARFSYGDYLQIFKADAGDFSGAGYSSSQGENMKYEND